MTNPPDCEQVRIAGMALEDGEPSPVAREDMDRHLSGCEPCRLALAEGRALNQAMKGLSLARSAAPPQWPALSPQLTPSRRTPNPRWLAAAALVVALVRLAMLVADAGTGWPARALPLAVAAALLVALRVNPFRIDAQLAPPEATTGR
ncbi:MAG: zf-HC2 domain-containing protein [Myxococcaceae bacterium]